MIGLIVSRLSRNCGWIVHWVIRRRTVAPESVRRGAARLAELRARFARRGEERTAESPGEPASLLGPDDRRLRAFDPDSAA